MASNGKSLRHLPLDQVQENPVALRAVDKKREEYVGLVDSIRKMGVLNPISVREVEDPESRKIVYAVIDGLHRFTAAKDAGLSVIPAMIIKLSEAEILEAQIIANVHKIETRKIEYALQLQRVLIQNPTLTVAELSSKLGKSPAWLNGILGLTKIKDVKIQELVNEGKINVSNAVPLSKLPEEEQSNFVDRAMTMSPAEFIEITNRRAKEIRDAIRKGQDVKPEEFVAIPQLRKLKELNSEISNLEEGVLSLKLYNITTPIEAWKACLRWVTKTDPKSVEVRKQQDNERKAAIEKKKEEAKEEKKKQRAREAAEKAADLML